MTDPAARTATAADWLEGARPRTWPNALAPVAAGTGAALALDAVHWGHAALALIVAFFLVVGVNYANDYSDGIRGTDDERVGPLRLTGSGLVAPRLVKFAAFACFGVAGLAGIVLSLSAGLWWLILIGILAVFAAWGYTGGSRPYGYRGLGEVAVFIFFGPVAVLGTQLTQAGTISLIGVLMSIAVGALSAAVNLTNNLRDIPTDSVAGKITLAVTLGDKRTRTLYVVLGVSALLITLILTALDLRALGGIIAAPLLYRASAPVRRGATGRDLIPVLKSTGMAMVVWAVATAAGFLLFP